MRSLIGALALGSLAFSVGASSAYASVTRFDYSGSIVTWTVPTTGIYRITTVGANGGENFVDIGEASSYIGGRGAFISGNLQLTANTTLTILVGGAGRLGSYSGSGGGGTFIALNAQPLVIAGGGGGAGMGGDGGHGRIETSGGNSMFQPGGTNGSGGSAQPIVAGAGGGFYSGGSGIPNINFNYNFLDAHGQSFLNGGAGGIPLTNPQAPWEPGRPGGFGGGGAAQELDQNNLQFIWQNAGGGGGGYSGGGGGGALPPGANPDAPSSYTVGAGGGGGGSFLDASALDAVKLAGFNTAVDGNGYATIEFIIPAPSAASLLALAGALASRRRR